MIEPMSTAPDELLTARRVVMKIGSSLLVDQAKGVAREDWLRALIEDIADLHRKGVDVMIVTSGAVALGRKIAALPSGALKLEEKQAAAAIGQIALARLWAEKLAEQGIVAGQVLLTPHDTEERRNYLNARATISRLWALKAVPVVNENDTVATTELRYGDNDRLAARVATMVDADLLILFSDVDGLYTAHPQKDPEAQHIPLVRSITVQIEAMAGGVGSELSRGGMKTKIEAAKIATAAGTPMVIADGRAQHPLAHIFAGGRMTLFAAAGQAVAHRKKWIAGVLEPRGTLHVDAGAGRALAMGKSLLPSGVKKVEGQFVRGDAVIVRTSDGSEIARGLVMHERADVDKIIGQSSREISQILGYDARPELIHRDDLVMAAEGKA